MQADPQGSLHDDARLSSRGQDSNNHAIIAPNEGRLNDDDTTSAVYSFESVSNAINDGHRKEENNFLSMLYSMLEAS
jgi:hypothetical protein